MISAVVPIFNEEESVQKFYAVLATSLSKRDKNYEIMLELVKLIRDNN